MKSDCFKKSPLFKIEQKKEIKVKDCDLYSMYMLSSLFGGSIKQVFNLIMNKIYSNSNMFPTIQLNQSVKKTHLNQYMLLINKRHFI